MKFAVHTSKLENTDKAIDELEGQVGSDNELLMLYGTAGHDWGLIKNRFNTEKYKNTQVVGATSCMGLLTSDEFVSNGEYALGVVEFKEFVGDIGVGSSFDKDSSRRGRQAFEQLLKNSNRVGECPDFVWILCSPGSEEGVLRDINDYYGTHIQLFGGSCADNAIEGEWKLLHGDLCQSDGVILVGFFSYDQNIYSIFQNGHIPLEKKAIVTAVQEREILEFDNKPALDVLNSWREGKGNLFEKNESILNEMTLSPIGRERGKIKDIPFYLLSHPSSVTETGGVKLFTEINEGDEVTLMTGSIERIQARVSDVVKTLLGRDEINKKDISGILIVYCAGCMLKVKESGDMNQISKDLKKILGDIPVLGIHTFGEQGNFFQDSESYHGNLMLSVTFFMG